MFRISIAVMLAAAFAIVMPPGAKADTITINQFFSAAPNAYGSLSWSGYEANALDSLQTTPGNPVGDPAQPTYYSVLGGTFDACNIMVTSFPSWNCSASPSGNFANELGERLHVGVVITDSGGTFDLQEVTFDLTSDDAAGNFVDAGDCPSGNGGSLCYVGDLSGVDFSSGSRIGLNSSGQVICDITHACDDTTQISTLIYVGIGNAEWPGGPGDLLTGQTAIDATTSYINENISSISNEYCVTSDSNGDSSCNTAIIRNANFVPEPSTLLLLGTSLCFLPLLLRRNGSGGSTT
jgi:PEP-CTERM motif